MKTKFGNLSVGLLALVLCGAATFSYAQQTDDNAKSAWSGHRRGGHMGYLARQLNLTDAQKQQVKSIWQSQKTTMRPLMQQMTQNRVAMLTATSNGAYDQAQVTALANQRAQLMAQMTVQKEAIRHQIYAQVLTSDQRATADQLRQKRLARLNQRLQKFSQPATDNQGE